MARKHLVGGNNIAIDVIGRDIHPAMARVLDAVHEYESLRRGFADRFGDGRHVIGDAGDGGCVQDGRNPHVRRDQRGILGRGNLTGGIVMWHFDIGFARHASPVPRGTAGCGMLDRRPEHAPAFRAAHDGGAQKAKGQLRAGFPDEKAPPISAEERGHIGPRPRDDLAQLARRGVIPALIVGNGGKAGGGFDNRFERQRPARVFEENARPRQGAFLHMGKAVTDGGKRQGGGR